MGQRKRKEDRAPKTAREVWSLGHKRFRPKGETGLLDLARERGSGFPVKDGERDKERRRTGRVYRERGRGRGRKRRPRDSSRKKEREKLRKGMERTV